MTGLPCPLRAVSYPSGAIPWQGLGVTYGAKWLLQPEPPRASPVEQPIAWMRSAKAGESLVIDWTPRRVSHAFDFLHVSIAGCLRLARGAL